MSGKRHAVLELGETRLAVVSAPLRNLEGLTPAEREVVVLLTRDLSDEEIAKARGTSKRTVANQVRSILAKLGVDGRRGVALALIQDD